MKVSIIVPVYNVEKYLEKCLDSLVNQTFKNIEIIIVNDGSTDNSEKIINKYCQKYHNIRNIYIENHGQGFARNIGMKNATGDYFMFVDSDDYVDKTIVQKLVSAIANSDIAVCNIYKVINNKKKLFINYHNYQDDQINLMLSHPGPVAKLYNKSVLNNIRFLENVYYEDLSFTPLVAINTKKISYVNEALYYYIIHDNSTMQQNKFNPKMDDIFKVMDYLSLKLHDYKEELQYLYIEHLLYSAVLRYIDFPKCNDRLKKINLIIKSMPNWNQNKYYKLKSFKFKLICELAYHEHYEIIRLLKKVRKNI